MKGIKSLLYIVSAGLIFLAGCAETEQFKTVEQICVPGLQKPVAMQAAEDVLGEMHFTINKVDVERGLIRTRPLPAAQLLEFWRSDSVGAFNWSEANLHNLRRIAEVDITQRGGRLCVGCNARTERLNLSVREESSSSQADRMFSAGRPSAQKLELSDEQKRDMVWVDLGRDARLETEILRRIESKIGER